MGATILFWAVVFAAVVWVAMALFAIGRAARALEELQAPDAVAFVRTWQEWIHACPRGRHERRLPRKAVHSAYWAGICYLEDSEVVPEGSHAHAARVHALGFKLNATRSLRTVKPVRRAFGTGRWSLSRSLVWEAASWVPRSDVLHGRMQALGGAPVMAKLNKILPSKTAARRSRGDPHCAHRRASLFLRSRLAGRGNEDSLDVLLRSGGAARYLLLQDLHIQRFALGALPSELPSDPMTLS